MTEIQKRVKEYVRNAGTTKEALASDIGMSRTAFFAKLRGANEFTIAEGYRLSQKMGITIDDLYEIITADEQTSEA